MTHQDTITIFDIPLSTLSKEQLLSCIEEDIEKNRGRYAVTPYSEMFVLAHKDTSYRSVLQHAHYGIPDGVVTAAYTYYQSLPQLPLPIVSSLIQWVYVLILLITNNPSVYRFLTPYKGRTFFVDLVSLANKNKYSVLLIGNGNESAQKAKEKLEIQCPHVNFHAVTGPLLDGKGIPVDAENKAIDSEIIEYISSKKPDIIFIAFGPPKQEYWISRVMPLVTRGFFVGVGGTFDYINTVMPLPPRWIEKANLEWLWRLFVDPKRVVRISNALFGFSKLAISTKTAK